MFFTFWPLALVPVIVSVIVLPSLDTTRRAVVITLPDFFRVDSTVPWWMASLLYGVGARDPLTIAVVGGILGCVALLDCYIPAHRATRWIRWCAAVRIAGAER